MNTQATTKTHSMYGTGTEMVEGQSIEEWAAASDLDFQYMTTPVQFDTRERPLSVGHYMPAMCSDNSQPIEILDYMPVMAFYDTKRVVYRSDNKRPLSIVGNNFKIVQPIEILEFFRNLVDDLGFTIVAAGSMKYGAVTWALAKTGKDFSIFGADTVEQYVLLSSSIDTTKATRAVVTSIRPSCSNMFEYIYGKENDSIIRIPHSKEYSKDQVQHNLGLVEDSWESFAERAAMLAGRPLAAEEVGTAIIRIFGDMELPINKQPNLRAMNRVRDLYNGQMKGLNETTEGTAWGLLNAVTEYVDHHAAERIAGNRQASAWLGAGNNTKRKAQEVLMEIS